MILLSLLVTATTNPDDLVELTTNLAVTTNLDDLAQLIKGRLALPAVLLRQALNGLVDVAGWHRTALVVCFILPAQKTGQHITSTHTLHINTSPQHMPCTSTRHLNIYFAHQHVTSTHALHVNPSPQHIPCTSTHQLNTYFAHQHVTSTHTYLSLIHI